MHQLRAGVQGWDSGPSSCPYSPKCLENRSSRKFIYRMSDDRASNRPDTETISRISPRRRTADLANPRRYMNGLDGGYTEPSKGG